MSQVCAVHGCPNIKPCDTHPGRARNAHWSKDRDRTQQRNFREAVLARDNYTCTRCGHHDVSGRSLTAHHDKPGYHPNCGRTLCNSKAQDCHHQVDTHAR